MRESALELIRFIHSVEEITRSRGRPGIADVEEEHGSIWNLARPLQLHRAPMGAQHIVENSIHKDADPIIICQRLTRGPPTQWPHSLQPCCQSL